MRMRIKKQTWYIDGVAVCDAHPDLEVFRLRLGKALDYGKWTLKTSNIRRPSIADFPMQNLTRIHRRVSSSAGTLEKVSIVTLL